MLGMLGGIAEASEGRHELVFAPTGRRRHTGCGRRSTGFPASGRSCRSRRRRTSGEALEPPAAHPGRAVRRVRWTSFHFSDWMYPPQRGGMRTTTVHDLGPIHPGVGRFENTSPPRPEGASSEDVRPLFANSRYTADDVVRTLGVRKTVSSSPTLGSTSGIWRTAAGRAPSALPAHDRDQRAAEEPQEPARGVCWCGRADRSWSCRRRRRGTRRRRRSSLPRLRRREDSARSTGARRSSFPRSSRASIPVVEAMASGTPTVVSTHNSLDEASGDAAIRVEPSSPEAIASGIETALTEGRARASRPRARAEVHLARLRRGHASRV